MSSCLRSPLCPPPDQQSVLEARPPTEQPSPACNGTASHFNPGVRLCAQSSRIRLFIDAGQELPAESASLWTRLGPELSRTPAGNGCRRGARPCAPTLYSIRRGGGVSDQTWGGRPHGAPQLPNAYIGMPIAAP